MAQIKKDAKIINMKIDKSVHEKLILFCRETGLSKTVATEKILNKFFAEYFALPESQRDLFNCERE